MPGEVEVREGRDAPGSAKNVQTAAPWCKALWFGPDALGEGGAGIPTGVAVLALGRIRLTLLTVYALWRLDTAGMPRRAAAVPADAMEPGDAPRRWSKRHGHAIFERPGLTRSIPMAPIASAICCIPEASSRWRWWLRPLVVPLGQSSDCCDGWI